MKSKITVFGLVFFLLSSITLAHAGPQESAEAIAIRVIDIDAATNTYTFECTIPQNYVQQYYWSSRETDLLETEFSTPNNQWTWQLDEKEYYHIGCGAYDAQGIWNLYDVHIDLREQRDTTKPILTVLSSDGVSVNARCDVPADMNNYRLEWVWNSEAEHVTMSEYDNQQTITFDAPSVQLWELACNIINLDDFSDWRNDASTMEFFDEGPAYVPNRLGCMPWECGTVEPFVGLSWEPIWSQGAGDFICGNFIVESGEQCDDGNSVNGDGCSSTCQTEIEEPVEPICGDGIIEEGEMCDDGNAVSGDGCSSTCQIEQSEQCFESVADMPLLCSGTVTSDTFNGCRTIVCSDKQVLACDKGGFFEMYNQGGPSSVEVCLGETCMSNEGYKKSGNYPICVASGEPNEPQPISPVCGNVIVENGEQCDDGNTVNGDGCSASCQFEKQFDENNFIIASHADNNIGELRDYLLANLPTTPYAVTGVSQRTIGQFMPEDLVETVTLVIYNDTALIVIDENAPVIDVIFGVDLALLLQMRNITATAILNVDAPSELFISQQCFESVSLMPLTCSGEITSDVLGGCRSIVCSDKQVLACDKGEFFEMYNQGGPSSVEVCLGETCMSNEGFIRSDNYPICTQGSGPAPVCGDGVVNQASEQCDDGTTVSGDGCSASCQIEESESNSSVTLAVAPWFPQGNNVVLVCSAGFTATSYDWYFGDGSSWIGSDRNDVWHTYPGTGSYTASCVAHGENMSAQDERVIVI